MTAEQIRQASKNTIEAITGHIAQISAARQAYAAAQQEIGGLIAAAEKQSPPLAAIIKADLAKALQEAL